MSKLDTEKLYAEVEVTERGVRVTTNEGTIAAGRFDFVIDQGADFSLPITWYDTETEGKDLSAYTAKLQGRTAHTDSTPALDLTQASGITLGTGEQNILITRTAAQTAALSFVTIVYDLVLTSGTSTRLIEGTITLRRRVSQ